VVVNGVRLELVKVFFDDIICHRGDMEAVFVEKTGDFSAEDGFHLGDIINLVRVKRHLYARKADHREVVFGVFLYSEGSGSARSEYDNFMAALT